MTSFKLVFIGQTELIFDLCHIEVSFAYWMRLIEHALQFNSPLGYRQRVTVDTVLTER